jgi:predicted metallopeptidase
LGKPSSSPRESAKTPFDFTGAMRALCMDVCTRLEEFRHIDMNRVAVSFAQTRRRVSYGLQAKLTPMRFEEGRLTALREDGRYWTVQRLYDSLSREMLYILTFYLPRFLDQSFKEKMTTVFHELYHISPRFNGDIRRLDGRYHVHSHSQKHYDEQMTQLARRYLDQKPPVELYAFLRKTFRGLKRHHGEVLGLCIPIPKLLPLPESKSA